MHFFELFRNDNLKVNYVLQCNPRVVFVYPSVILPELLAMGPDFVYGVINAIDGERDPRILVQIFDFIPKFLQRYPLRHLSEEFFEVCACYFPVDFHPAPNDPAGITRDKLAEKLSDCLCGTEDFAEHCITLLLEKLDSGLNVAKLDSLDLLVSIKILDYRQEYHVLNIFCFQYVTV